LNLVNALAGNLDVEGGLCFPEGVGDHLPYLSELRGGFDRYRSPEGIPEVGGEYPCVILADQIERGFAQPAPKDALRALLVQSGNPVLSAPNGRRIAEAFGKLEHLVAVDIYLSETARLAHVVLPPRSALHDLHFDFIFSQLTVENVAKASAPVLPPPADGQPSEFDILKRIALDTFARLPASERPLGRRLLARVARHLTVERLADLIIRTGPFGDRWNPFSRGLNLTRLLAHPHGLPARPLEPGRLPKLLARSGAKRLDLAPKAYLDDLPRLERELAASPDPNALTLIGRRHLKSNNSWFHNVGGSRMKGRRCTLLVHPDDAARRGLASGERASVRSRAGALEVEVEVSAEVARGVVSLPHGWGHALHGGAVASATPGESVNDLTDEKLFDPLTGTAALNHVPVEVAPAAARRAAEPALAAAGA
jgi:anaerobic selenocysteine-containing dehydrogenase